MWSSWLTACDWQHSLPFRWHGNSVGWKNRGRPCVRNGTIGDAGGESIVLYREQSLTSQWAQTCQEINMQIYAAWHGRPAAGSGIWDILRRSATFFKDFRYSCWLWLFFFLNNHEERISPEHCHCLVVTCYVIKLFKIQARSWHITKLSYFFAYYMVMYNHIIYMVHPYGNVVFFLIFKRLQYIHMTTEKTNIPSPPTTSCIALNNNNNNNEMSFFFH